MNYREETFRQKFDAAAHTLGVTPEQVESLKLRENVNSYHEYHDLLYALEHDFGLRRSDVSGNMSPCQ